MIDVDRAFFCLPGTNPYLDAPQGIACQQTISAPHIHAMSLEVLREQVSRTNGKVLDVGSGSGYVAAAFATMNPSAIIFGIELHNDLVEWSKRNVQKLGHSLNNLHLRQSNGWDGLLSEGPFDAINVGAAADTIPAKLANSLKVGGRMLIPVGPEGGLQKMVRVDRVENLNANGPDVIHPPDFEFYEDMQVAFVPLTKE